MHLYLEFQDGVIKGEGTDYVGPWIASGAFDERSGQCDWVKRYVDKHEVHYSGVASDQGIRGTWEIAHVNGPFHIWPKDRSDLAALFMSDEVSQASPLNQSW